MSRRTLIIVGSDILAHDHATGGRDVTLFSRPSSTTSLPPTVSCMPLPYPLRSSVLEHVTTFIRCTFDLQQPADTTSSGTIPPTTFISLVLGDSLHRVCNRVVNGWGRREQGPGLIFHRLLSRSPPRPPLTLPSNDILNEISTRYGPLKPLTSYTPHSHSHPLSHSHSHSHTTDLYYFPEEEEEEEEESEDDEDGGELVRLLRNRVNRVIEILTEKKRKSQGLFSVGDDDGVDDDEINGLVEELIGGERESEREREREREEVEISSSSSSSSSFSSLDEIRKIVSVELFWGMILDHFLHLDPPLDTNPERSSSSSSSFSNSNSNSSSRKKQKRKLSHRKKENWEIIYISKGRERERDSTSFLCPFPSSSLKFPNCVAEVKLTHIKILPAVSQLEAYPRRVEVGRAEVGNRKLRVDVIPMPMNVLCTMHLLSGLLLFPPIPRRMGMGSGLDSNRVLLCVKGLIEEDRNQVLPMIGLGVAVDLTQRLSFPKYGSGILPNSFVAHSDESSTLKLVFEVVSQERAGIDPESTLANLFHTKSIHLASPMYSISHPLTRILLSRLLGSESVPIPNRIVMLRLLDPEEELVKQERERMQMAMGSIPIQQVSPTHFLMIHHNRIFVHVIHRSSTFRVSSLPLSIDVLSSSSSSSSFGTRLRTGDFDSFLLADITRKSSSSRRGARRSQLTLVDIPLQSDLFPIPSVPPMTSSDASSSAALSTSGIFNRDLTVERIESRKAIRVSVPSNVIQTTAPLDRMTRLFPLRACRPGALFGLRKYPVLTNTVLDPILNILYDTRKLVAESRQRLMKALEVLSSEARSNGTGLTPSLGQDPTKRFEVLRGSWYELRLLALVVRRKDIVIIMDRLWPHFVFISKRKMEQRLGKRTIDVKRLQNGVPELPIMIGSTLSIDSLGRPDRRKGYFTDKYIWPIGFQSTRVYFDVRNVENKVGYVCQVVDGGHEPRYVITSEALASPITGSSATSVWTVVVKRVNELKTAEAGRRVFTNVSGPDYYGLANPVIIQLVAELPGAELCLPRPEAPFKMACVTQPDDFARYCSIGSLGVGSGSSGGGGGVGDVSASSVPPPRSSSGRRRLDWIRNMKLSTFLQKRIEQAVQPVEFDGVPKEAEFELYGTRIKKVEPAEFVPNKPSSSRSATTTPPQRVTRTAKAKSSTPRDSRSKNAAPPPLGPRDAAPREVWVASSMRRNRAKSRRRRFAREKKNKKKKTRKKSKRPRKRRRDGTEIVPQQAEESPPMTGIMFHPADAVVHQYVVIAPPPAAPDTVPPEMMYAPPAPATNVAPTDPDEPPTKRQRVD